MHKDTEYRLNVCERYAIPRDRDGRDLTENRDYARMAIAAAHRFFRFNFANVRFSGFAREHDRWDGEVGDYGPAFYIELWHRNEVVRQVGIRSLGILGTMHVDVTSETLEEAISQDFLGGVGKAINTVRDIKKDYPRYVRAFMDEHYMYLEVDMCP